MFAKNRWHLSIRTYQFRQNPVFWAFCHPVFPAHFRRGDGQKYYHCSAGNVNGQLPRPAIMQIRSDPDDVFMFVNSHL